MSHDPSENANLLLKKHFLLLSMVKTIVLFKIFGKRDKLFQDFSMNRKFKRTAFFPKIQIFCNCINAYTVT